MNFKLYLFIGCIALSLSMLATTPEKPRDSFDDLLDFVDNPEMSDLISNTEFDTTRQASKETVVTVLNELGVPALLQENFFLRSNILKSRSLLDYIEFFPFRHDKDKRAVYVDLFYNQTSRAFFNKHSSNICSYLAISQAGFLGQFEAVIREAAKILPEAIPNPDQIIQLLTLLQTFTVQERRFGLMIGGKTSCNRWHFNIMAPWYYLERNHFVDQKVQENLAALTTDLFGPPTSPGEAKMRLRQQHAFENAHLISDAFGIGDTRFYADYPIIKKKYWSTRLGLLATIPTAFPFQRGLRGSSFHRVKYPPTLDLVQLFDTFMPGGPPTTSGQNAAFDYVLTFIDNLSAMLIQAPMGNGGHFGIGIYARNRSPLTAFIQQAWAHRCILRSFMSLEYQFPATEWRSFRVPVDEALFNSRNFNDTEDMAVLNSNYEFLLQQINDRFFPRAYQATIWPGIIFRWSSQLCYEGNKNGFTIGTDTYVRNPEKISSINATRADIAMIDRQHATYPVAYQAKAVGSVFFKVEKPDKLWVLSFIGDYTFMNHGIGSDFMLAFNVDVTF